MRNFIIMSCLLAVSLSYGQEDQQSRKGSFYLYWGYNASQFSGSDIRFKGENFDFTLEDVYAEDRPSEFNTRNLEFHRLTIPQYNFRIGYYITDKWDLSLGVDHMKYVVQRNQRVRINGTIDDPSSIYNGVYDNDLITVERQFLRFEHTDGLNYANLSLRRNENILEMKHFQVDVLAGLGGGVLYPKTRTHILGRPSHDKFHVSGYGIDATAGMKFLFFNHFFMQSEIKKGYINMPDILISQLPGESASQSFFFTQFNFTVGALFKI